MTLRRDVQGKKIQSVGDLASAGEELSEPRTWLLITNRTKWSIFATVGAWAFHNHSMPRARQISPGDEGVVYLTQGRRTEPSAIAAIVSFTGAGEVTDGSGLIGAFYPFRVPFRIVKLADPPVAVKELLPRLSFLPRKERFGVFLQGKSAILLPQADATIVKDAVRVSGTSAPEA